MDVFEVIVAEAERHSVLWHDALLERERRQALPVFSPLGDERYALGLETIYEGYLLHHGRPRLFAPAEADAAVLLGDYLYAHGLVRIAAAGQVDVVGELAELISVCSQIRAEPDRSAGTARPDGAAWAATVACLGRGEPALATARAALRDGGDPDALARLAEERAGAAAVARALALHAERVE